MRRVLLPVAFAVLALTAGCQSSPPSAPNSAADGGNASFFSRLFGHKSSSSDGTNEKTAVGPNGVPLGKKTKQDLAIESTVKRGGVVQVAFQGMERVIVVADLHGFHNAAAALEKLAPLTMLRELNLYNTAFNDADLVILRGLPNLQNLNLSGTKVTDAGLRSLQTLPKLSVLNLNGTRITNAGLQYLRGMANLTDLSLYQTKVSDEGLAQIRGTTTLRKLVLGGNSSITDRGLFILREMPQLHELTLLASGATDSGIEDLKVASTQLRVIH